MKHLVKQGLLKGRLLDYGSGRGQDADLVGAEKYDLNHHPFLPLPGFDTITCNYVLNVIEDPIERATVVAEIRALLAPDGVAYISVRNDKFNEGTTSRGTWQGYVGLTGQAPIKTTSGFRMYRIEK